MKPNMKHFSVFYLNFEKVFEIAMLLDNKVAVEQEESTDNQHTSKITARVQAMLSAIFKAEGEGSYEYTKTSGLKKTIEIKSTNAVILRDLIDEIHSSKSEEKETEEGQLVIIDDLNLSIVNEEEMRQMKLIKQGVLDRFTHEDIPLGEVVKSFVTDYSYILTGRNTSGNYLLKIPSQVENEFENSYTIDDLLMSKITLIGVFKGVRKIEDIKSTFKYLKGNENKKVNDSKIEHSSDEEEKKAIEAQKGEEDYYFIDTLAIVHKLKLGDQN